MTERPPLPPVLRITDTYARATLDQRTAGARWYPTARRIVDTIATSTGVQVERVTMALAALSPRNPWLWNIADAYAYALAASTGGEQPSATTFGANRDRAWTILTEPGRNDWATAAPKVRAFTAAILGDRNAVVVDTWAYRVATGKTPPNGISVRAYDTIARAYADAAREIGQDPRDVQATTWLVAQSEGLASMRRGRHDLAPKRGTGDILTRLGAI